jgi:hypothetical protein
MSLAIFNPIHVEVDPDLQIIVGDWEQKREPSTGQVQRRWGVEGAAGAADVGGVCVVGGCGEGGLRA